jgi:exosortase D (VPLPA-CTERM-specific)
LLSGAILATLVVWLYHPLLMTLIRQWWDDPNYSHGFLIPILSLYFAWQRRERLWSLSLHPNLLGLLLLIGGVGLYLLGTLAAELFTMRTSLVVVLAGLVLYILGPEHLQITAFPILYLLFMIPLPAIIFNAVAFPLQLFAARTASATLDLLGVPVLREGNIITLAKMSLEVAEACSGIRSLITLLAVAATYSYFTRWELWRRAVLLFSAIPIAIIANAGRVAGTGLLADHFGPEVARSFFHIFSGWIVFVAAFSLLLTTGLLLGHITATPYWDTTLGKIRLTGRFFRHAGKRFGRGRRHVREGLAVHTWRRVAIAAGVLAAGIVSLQLVSRGEAVPLRRSLKDFPIAVEPWQGMDQLPDSETLRVLRVTDFMRRQYTAPGLVPIGVYVGYYESQRTGVTIHSPQQCLPGSGWGIIRMERIPLPRPQSQGDPIVINRVLVAKGIDRQVVVYWYQERGRVVASEYWAKAYLVWDSITRSRTDGALVRISVPVTKSEENAYRHAVQFAQRIFPMLSEYLPG